MNDMPHHDDELDLLISRTVDGEATRVEWTLLESHAHEEPSLWRRVALAHRDHQLLAHEVNAAAARADRLNLPEPESISHNFPFSSRFARSARVWGGWAAAAVLTLAFGLRGAGVLPAGNTGPAQPAQAGVAPSLDQLLNDYLTKGKQEGAVLGEVPTKTLMEASPIADGGGYEIIFARIIIERDRVPDLYRFGQNEAGDMHPIRVKLPSSTPTPQ